MNTEDIIKEFVSNHSEEEILAYCSSELISKHNLIIRELCNKNYEKAAGAAGESTFPLAVLAALNTKKNKGNKKDVVVA